MPVKKIFVASSTAAKFQAKKFIEGCSSHGIVFLPWWDEIAAGETLLTQLTMIKRNVDGAVIILSPEFEGTIRKAPQSVPNLNVLFEFGFFYGAFEHDRVAIVKYGDFYLPTDLGGYVHIFGAKGFTRSGGNKPSKRTVREFENWISRWRD